VTRRRILLLFVPMALILLVAAAAAWLLRTESGARWMWQRLAHAVPGELQLRSLSGDLQSGLRLQGLSWSDEGVQVDVDTARFTLDLGVWPLAVTVNRLDYGEISIRVLPESGDESGGALSLKETLAGLALPFPLALDRVRGGLLVWNSGAPEPDFSVDRLSLSAYWFGQLELNDVVADLGESHWEGRGSIDLQAPFALELDLGGRIASELTGLGRPVPLSALLRGDLEKADLQLDADSGGVQLKGQVSGLAGTPAWDLRLLAPRLSWPLEGSADDGAEPWVAQQLEVSSYGSLDDYGVELSGELKGPGWPATRLRLVASGNADGIDARVFEVDGAALTAAGPLQLAWRPERRVEATLDVERADPSAWWAEWGEAPPVSGQVTLSWSGERLELKQFSLGAPTTFAALRGSGAIDLDSGVLTADLDWENVSWPPGASDPVVTSATGRGNLEGTLAGWHVAGELDLAGPDFPAGRLQLRGGGDTESLRFEVPRAQVLGGTLEGSVAARWEPTLSWAVEASVDGIATAPLAPDFPGRLGGRLKVEQRPASNQAGDVIDIDIQGLAGQVRGRDVAARGGLTLAGDRTRARSLEIRSGTSMLTLDGHLAEPSGLRFTANITDLADLVDGAHGAVNGQGRAAFVARQPVLELDLEGRDLQLGESAIELLTIESGSADAGLRAELSNVSVGESHFDSVILAAEGDQPLEQISLQVSFATGQVAAKLSGGVVDWSRPLASGWSGSLDALSWEENGLGQLRLERPATLTLSPGASTLDDACLRGPLDGQLCIEAAWRDDSQLFDARLQNVSANLALALLNTDLSLSQRLSGQIEWRRQLGALPVARANLAISPGVVTLAGEEEELLETRQGLLAFDVADGRLFGGNLDIPFVGAGGIDTDFGVPDLSEGLDSPVQGRLRVDMESIEPLLRMLPAVEGRSGPVTADLVFSGTLADPQMTGHMSLVRGRISHFATGLLLEDIRLAGAVYRNDETQLFGSFRAGEGEGQIEAVLKFADLLRPEASVHLLGNNLALVNVPDLQVRANPDLRLGWSPDGLQVDGQLTIPSARISPRNAPGGGATESPDVVIVRGEDPYAEDEAARQRERRINGQLQVNLGDDVFIILDRARAQLGGSAQFHWHNQLIPVASGGFTLSGEINAYGQSLEVTEGRVNFSERPADNPFLNIRAEREIYGNSQVRRAGVLVTGTLKRPVLETYTVPMTTRERALTLLVTGSDFDYEQGVGSVEVGMYIAPKLYISYGVGLFENQNVISARYDLGKGFGIKTTSGQRETGADISYTIDR